MALHLKIIAPDQLVFEGDARSVRLPAELGEMEVLPHHADYAALLKEGALSVELSSGERKDFALKAAGLVEIAKDQVTVFADRVA